MKTSPLDERDIPIAPPHQMHFNINFTLWCTTKYEFIHIIWGKINMACITYSVYMHWAHPTQILITLEMKKITLTWHWEYNVSILRKWANWVFCFTAKSCVVVRDISYEWVRALRHSFRCTEICVRRDYYSRKLYTHKNVIICTQLIVTLLSYNYNNIVFEIGWLDERIMRLNYIMI